MSPKKSEMLEIRLSHPLKQAFMARCRSDGATASETVRRLIDAYLTAPVHAPRRRAQAVRIGIASAIILGAAAVAAPSMARPSLQAAFATMDLRHEGQVSFSEFAAGAAVKATVALSSGSLRAPGVLDEAIRTEILKRQFDAMDLDHNGRLTFEEFRRAYGG